MDVLNSNLEAVETADFRRCDFHREITAEVLVNDAIRRGEEGKDVGDQVVFVVSEMIPICSVGLEVDRMRLRLSCTFARCHRVGWEKEQNDGGLLEEAVRGQGVLRFCQSCVSMMG